MVLTKRTEYNGNPILEIWLHEHDTRPFRFGVKKAQWILECIDDIKAFVKDNVKEDKKGGEK